MTFLVNIVLRVLYWAYKLCLQMALVHMLYIIPVTAPCKAHKRSNVAWYFRPGRGAPAAYTYTSMGTRISSDARMCTLKLSSTSTPTSTE